MGASRSFSWEEWPWGFVLRAAEGVLSMEFLGLGLCVRCHAGAGFLRGDCGPTVVACELSGGKMKINENNILSPSSVCPEVSVGQTPGGLPGGGGGIRLGVLTGGWNR